MDIGERLQWLSSLEVGDEVGIFEELDGNRHTFNYSKDKIVDIHEDGTFHLSKGTLFDRNGESYHENTHLGVIFKYKLVPLTDGIKNWNIVYQINKTTGMMTGGPL